VCFVSLDRHTKGKAKDKNDTGMTSLRYSSVRFILLMLFAFTNMAEDYTMEDIASPFDPIGDEDFGDEDFEPDASETGGEGDDDESDSDYEPDLNNNTTPDSIKRHRLILLVCVLISSSPLLHSGLGTNLTTPQTVHVQHTQTICVVM
jgi:hypothetical protein